MPQKSPNMLTLAEEALEKAKKEGMIEAAKRILNVYETRESLGHRFEEIAKGMRAECQVIIEFSDQW